MRIKVKNYVILILCLNFSVTGKCQLCFNEVMQSNVDCVLDDLNEFPDSWVELYNSNNDTIKLEDYSIGLSDKSSESYKLPPKEVAPHSFVLIYCDKEAQGLHTDFRIDSGKGEIFLFKNGNIVNHIKIKKQPAPNIAYGRKTENDDDWDYQLVPTPGFENSGQIANGMLPSPEFSVKSKILTEGDNAFVLKIELPTDAPIGAIIRYTLDGSEPTEKSVPYERPLTIDSTCVIRAKSFSDGYLSPRSVVRSFIFFPRKQNLPIVSMVTDDSFLYSDSIGIYSNNIYRNDSVNFRYDWRRPVNISYFNVDGEEVINQLCETRIHGGGSRQYPLKSMVCYANKRFGEKRFNYEFFPSQRPGIKEQKSFILRNSGSDFVYLYMRDAIIQGVVQKHMKLDCQAFQPVVFYLNGEYKGLMYLMERSTEDNIETNYGIEDFDMIENWNELKCGTWDNFNMFEDFYSKEGHSFEEYEKWMDVDEYCDYMIMELFFANRDWPNNNIVMWRPRTADGKWRWLVKDMDFGLGLETGYDFNMFPWLYGDESAPNEPFRRLPQKKHTILFQNLMKNDKFKEMFVKRSLSYMEDYLNSKGIHEVWDSLWTMVGEEYKIHRTKYVNWGWTWKEYDDVRKGVDRWIQERPAFYEKQLKEFYGIDDNETSLNDVRDKRIFEVINGNFVFCCKSGIKYRLYDLKGVVLHEGVTMGKAEKPISLHRGVYFLSINGETYKFLISE